MTPWGATANHVWMSPDPKSPDPESLDAAELDDLLRVAHAVSVLAYSPYSKVNVGAALLCEDGEVFTGCNVENASFGMTLCAERAAISKAVSMGERTFRAIVIASALDDPMMPCGACRQVLREFADDLEVIVQGAKGPRVRTRLSELLPQAFGPEDLGEGPAAGGESDA